MTKYCADLQGGLWLQLNSQNNTWYAKPCCMYQQSFKVEHDIKKEFWQHPQIIAERQANLDGHDLPDNCKTCQKTEQNGNYSRRQSWNERLGTTWARPDSVIELDIQCDFSCNLACRICGPQFSTLWRQVDPAYDLYDKFRVRANNSSVLELLKSMPFHDIKQIHFQGGEPLLSHTHLQVLELLEQHIDVSKITLWYHTNGTQQVQDKILRFWEKFKSVEIYFSLDDMGPRMEYQRWPVQWQHLHDTLLWWKDNLSHNTLLNVERTVGVLNAFWLDELDAWHEQYFKYSKHGDAISLNYHQAAGVYSLSATSDAYRQAVLEKFSSDHWAHKTFKTLPQSVESNIKNMFINLNRHDQLRNQDWRAVYPEFLDWYLPSLHEPELGAK